MWQNNVFHPIRLLFAMDSPFILATSVCLRGEVDDSVFDVEDESAIRLHKNLDKLDRALRGELEPEPEPEPDNHAFAQEYHYWSGEDDSDDMVVDLNNGGLDDFLNKVSRDTTKLGELVDAIVDRLQACNGTVSVKTATTVLEMIPAEDQVTVALAVIGEVLANSVTKTKAGLDSAKEVKEAPVKAAIQAAKDAEIASAAALELALSNFDALPACELAQKAAEEAKAKAVAARNAVARSEADLVDLRASLLEDRRATESTLTHVVSAFERLTADIMEIIKTLMALSKATN